MKYVVILGDGMADTPSEKLDGKMLAYYGGLRGFGNRCARYD